MSDLLPCPWCGHAAFVAVHEVPNHNHGVTWWRVCCRGCGVSFPLNFQRDGSVREWNSRAATPSCMPEVHWCYDEGGQMFEYCNPEDVRAALSGKAPKL